MTPLLPPETVAEKVFAIIHRCQDTGFITRYQLTELENTITTIGEDDFIGVVVNEEIIDDSISVKLAKIWPSERADAILQRYSELVNKPVETRPVDLPRKWRPLHTYQN